MADSNEGQQMSEGHMFHRLEHHIRAVRERMELFMADIDQALADLASGVSAVATRVQADIDNLKQQIAVLQAAGSDTTQLQAAADNIESQVAALASIDPTNPPQPVQPVQPTPDQPTPPAPTPDQPPGPGPAPAPEPAPAPQNVVVDPSNNLPLYSFVATAGSPDLSQWTQATDVRDSGGGVLFTFNNDTAGQPPTGVSDGWQLYEGAITVVTPPAGASVSIDQSAVSATIGQPYVGSVTASGGNAPYTFDITDLPDGLSSDAEGNITGTPTTPGSTEVSVTATDADGASGSGTVTFNVS